MNSHSPRLRLPRPCEEAWEGMQPSENGRFCAVCTTEVVDFTAMEEAEIIAYLQEHKDRKICGRFDAKQIQTPEEWQFGGILRAFRWTLTMAGFLLFAAAAQAQTLQLTQTATAVPAPIPAQRIALSINYKRDYYERHDSPLSSVRAYRIKVRVGNKKHTIISEGGVFYLDNDWFALDKDGLVVSICTQHYRRRRNRRSLLKEQYPEKYHIKQSDIIDNKIILLVEARTKYRKAKRRRGVVTGCPAF